MNNYFNKVITYNEISLNYCRTSSISDREIHNYHEILYYMDGGAVFLTDNYQQILKPGTLIIIPKEHYHFFKLKEPQKFTRLKITFPESMIEETPLSEMMSRIRIIKELPENMSFIINHLLYLFSEAVDDNNNFRAFASMLMLLSEISVYNKTDEVIACDRDTDVISAILEYINQNLSKDLSAKSISHELNYSVSTITHVFKKELGIPIHKYVTQKRLVYAETLLSNNQKPTRIYSACGYNDYSSFYKAYTKHFGYPPSSGKL